MWWPCFLIVSQHSSWLSSPRTPSSPTWRTRARPDGLSISQSVSPRATRRSSSLSLWSVSKVMASDKGLAKMVSKQAGRAKEKLMQNLGKADRTRDELLDEHLQHFQVQQQRAQRLNKDVNYYIRCVKAMQTASKGLMETLSESYEQPWPGHDAIYVQSQNSEMLWADLYHKLSDQVSSPLAVYTSTFPEVRRKIEKRNRKLIDFDLERHRVQQQQQQGATRNEAKLARTKERMESARRVYDNLNGELLDELPALFSSRAAFAVENMHALFAALALFHRETAKVFASLDDAVDKLDKFVDEEQRREQLDNRPNKAITNKSEHIGSMEKSKEMSGGSSSSRRLDAYEPVSNKYANDDAAVVNDKNKKNNDNEENKGHYSIPSLMSSIEGTTGALPPGVLYAVRASYKYVAEDVDELNFEVGEVIHVVPYEDPEEQEEGWLTGIKQSTGQKGLFPANFTKPIN